MHLDPIPAPAVTASGLRRFSRPAAFAVVATVLGLTMGASGVPSPLYALYQAEWGFSTFTLTLIFGAYALGVLVALLFVGRISDDIGRRPALLTAIAGLLLSATLFVAATSVAWLVAARLVQGVFTGLMIGTAGAALLDFHPGDDGRAAGLVNGAGSGVGMGIGALSSASLAQYAGAPLRTPYIALMAALVLALLVATLLPEPVVPRRRPRLAMQAPGVPRGIRAAFLLTSLGLVASWSVMGLFMALGPKLAAEVMDTSNRLAGGATLALVIWVSVVTQVAARHLTARRDTVLGAPLLAAGVLATAASLSAHSGVLFLLCGALIGVGFGLTFLGSLRTIARVAPSDHRAEVMSAFYLVAYTTWTVPALTVGLITAHAGLMPTFRVFAVVVAVVALGVAGAARRIAPDDDAAAVIPASVTP